MDKIKKILYYQGHFYFWSKKDLQTDLGVIKESDLKKAKSSIKTHLGKEFHVLEPNFLDIIKRIKRGPQIITKKDIGFIITETGISKTSTILDAGTGSGYLAFFLSKYAKKVISYEKREDFYNIAVENRRFMGIKNLAIKNKDIYAGIEEKNLDVIILDLPEPFRAVEHAFNALKQGGYLLTYLPTIPQVIDFINTARKKFTIIKVAELMERNWTVDNQVVRPETQMLGHTAFLCLVRKI